MSSNTRAEAGATLIELEFDTGTKGGALLGDVAASLVSLDELLRDLASIAAYPSSAEFRKIEITSIEIQSPLTVRLSLFGISPDAVRAFEALCRYVIVFRKKHPGPAGLTGGESDEAQAPRVAQIKNAVDLCTPVGAETQLTNQEAQRLEGHVVTLQRAEIPLRRVQVKEG